MWPICIVDMSCSLFTSGVYRHTVQMDQKPMQCTFLNVHYDFHNWLYKNAELLSSIFLFWRILEFSHLQMSKRSAPSMHLFSTSLQQIATAKVMRKGCRRMRRQNVWAASVVPPQQHVRYVHYHSHTFRKAVSFLHPVWKEKQFYPATGAHSICCLI